MQEKIQQSKTNFCGSEGKLRDLCLVSIDRKWHRARILSMREENYEVFLIDQAQPHSTTSDMLAWGEDECFILPPKIESCVLANVLFIKNNWPERALNFLKSLPGKEFKGLVQHALMPDRTILLDVPTITKHLCKEGVSKKIPCDEFKNLVLKYLNLPEEDSMEPITTVQSLKACNQFEKGNHYFYPELCSDTFESIRVTQMIDPENIFCELLIFSSSIKILTEQLNEELKNQSDIQDLQPQSVGMPCAAQGLDGKWRRAVLKQPITSQESSVAVFFVDEGKFEMVQPANVKKIDPKFLRMPVVTYRCNLEGLGNKEWTKEDFDHLKLLLSQKLVARFERHSLAEDIYAVNFYMPNADCINDLFLKKEDLPTNGNAKPKFMHNLISNCATHEVTGPKKYLKNVEQQSFSQNCPSPFSPNEMSLCDLLTVGTSVGVKISCIDSPKKFWCQTAQCDQKLDGLMKDLQVYYASVHPKPLVEQICVARNPDNNMWYRAKILASQLSPDVEVRFIDYGETKKVPLQQLRPIDPTFLRLDAQAFQCSLFNLPATDADYVSEEFHKFITSNSAQNSGLKCVIKAVASDKEGLPLNVVELQTQSESASQVLIEKLASRPQMYNHSSQDISVNSKEKICISYSEAVHSFYSQLDRNVHLFQHVQNNIEKLVDSLPSDSTLAPNSLCIVRDSYSTWYRGQVLEALPDLKVYLVDLGKTLVVNRADVRAFPREASAVRAIPTLAIPMALFNIPAEIPQEINEWFTKKVVGCAFSVTVIEKGQNGKLMVELFDGLKSLNAQVRERIVSIQVKNGHVYNGSKMAQVSHMEIDESEVVQQNNSQKLPGIQSEHDMEDWILVDIEPNDTTGDKESPEMIIETTTEPTSAMEIDDENKKSEETNKVTTPDHKIPHPKYKKPILSFNKTQELHASFISTPEFFWCQCSNTGDLDKVTALAQIEGKAAQDLFFPSLLPHGHPCLAFSKSGNQWYRAQVIQKYDKTFTVVYIDYGNEEKVAYKDVRPLSDSLLDVAPQAFLCTLDDISCDKYSNKFFDKFCNVLADKPLKVKVLRMGYNSEVNLPQYTVQIEDVGLHKFLQKCGITSGGDVLNQSLKKGTKTVFYNNPTDLLSKTVKVFASSISSPAHFWCQYNNDKELDRITKLAQKSGWAEDPLFPESLTPESPCLALYSVDNEWCRAQVISRGKDKFKVVFVDYGNEEEIPIFNVRPIPLSLMEVPAQAFLCCMENFSEDTTTWDDALYDAFEHLLSDKLITIKIVSMEHNEEVKVPQYTVRFDYDLEKFCSTYARSVQKFNVPKNVSQNTPPAPPLPPSEAPEANIVPSQYKKPQLTMNQTVMAYASSISGTDYFWCQYSDPEQLDEITRLAQNKSYALYDLKFVNDLTPGCPCLALFSEDKEWCRAQILSKTQDKFKVLFIDHGNEDEVNARDLRPISLSLLEMPPQAFLCRLEGFNLTTGAGDEEFHDHFFSLLVDNLLKVTPTGEIVNEEAKFPQFVVQIQCGDMAVNNAMQKYLKANGKIDELSSKLAQNLNVSIQQIFKNPNVALDSIVQVYATCIVDPHYFWCQFADSSHLNQIEKLSEEAWQSQKRPETLDKGDLCLALFSSDNKWYRALVSKKTNDKLNMIFIDYGNEAEVTINDTRVLPQSLLKQPPQAFLCTLHGFEQTKGTWEDQGCDDFFELLVDKVLKVKIVTMEDNQGLTLPQYTVEIDFEGANMNTLMEKYWRGDSKSSGEGKSKTSGLLEGDK